MINDTRYRSRKFLLALATLLSCVVLVWFERISDGVFSAVVIATVGAYLTANVAQKSVEKAAVLAKEKARGEDV